MMTIDYSQCLEHLREAAIALGRRAETDRSVRHAAGQVARAYARMQVRAAEAETVPAAA